jgi:hypothetical protein
MQLINKINNFLSKKNPKHILIASCICLLFFILIINLILKPAPPLMPEFFHGKDKLEITRGLNWHLKNNPGQILGDSKSCNLNEEKKLIIKCDFISQDFNFEIKSKNVINEITSQKSKFKDFFWNSDTYYTNKINALAFTPYNFTVKEIKSISETQGIFGNELQVAFIIHATQISQKIDLLDNLLNNDEKFKIFQNNLNSKLPLEYEIKLNLYNNRYGHFLPIKTLN